MLYTINSKNIEAKVDTFGAELHSLKKDGHEYLWQSGDAWKRYAPILFPFISNTPDKNYFVNGKKYTMPSNHGFARDSEFTYVSSDETSVEFSLKSNEKTKEIYPFDFELLVKYIVEDGKITLVHTVKNLGDGDMYFYLGGHPAFNCPLEDGLSFEDYYVEYEKEETIIQQTTGNVIIENERKIPVSRKLFDFDALIKDKPNSKAVSLKSDKSDKSVTVVYPESECIAVWSPIGNDDAAFVCLEPWTSVPTVEDREFSDLEKMPHAKKLEAKGEFTYTYSIVLE